MHLKNRSRVNKFPKKQKSSGKTTPTVDKINFHSREQKIAEIHKYGTRSLGRQEFIRFLEGRHISRNEGIKAFCFDCCGWYVDGKTSCAQILCPLFPFMPYRDGNVLELPAQAAPAKNGHALDRVDVGAAL